MKKLFSLILVLSLIFSLAACGAQTNHSDPDIIQEATDSSERSETRIFTDSTGRNVEIPSQIDKIALSGPLSQIVLFALCPEKLVGIASEWDASAEKYLDTAYYNLPVIGQLYGTKGELNLETLLSSGAQIVIDVGEPKSSIVEDMDALQAQTGLPFVHVTMTTDTIGDAYRMLGDLLGKEEKAEELASYSERIYSRTLEIADNVKKVNLLYVTGEEGHNVVAYDSFHSEVIDLLGNNLAVVEEPSSKGTGNEVGMEQIMTWNPDVIIFSDQSIYGTVADDPAWQSITALRNGDYYEVPFGPYNWIGFPPSVQRLLGMMWMAKLLYPEATEAYDLYEDVKEYYSLFYHCELTYEQYEELMANSIGKQ